MLKKHLLATLILAAISGSSYTAEIPKDLLGKWSNIGCGLSAQGKRATDIWTGLVITKSGIEWKTQFCKAKKVSNAGSRFILDMLCTPRGDEDFEATYIFDLSADSLKESGPKFDWSNTYKRCS